QVGHRADRVSAVPIRGSFAHRIEDAYAGRGRFGHLDDRAGMALVEEVDERATRRVALLADAPAVLERPVADLVVVDRPARPVLQAFMAGPEEVLVEARHAVALLDQFELHVARIGEGDRHLDVVDLALVAELVEWQLLGVEPRTDAAYLRPVLHRLVDVADD